MIILEAYLRGLQRGIASVYQAEWRDLEEIRKDIDKDISILKNANKERT